MKTKLRLVSSHGHLVIQRVKSSALSPFGPVRAGLTTLPRTNQDQVLMELLNSLEKKVAELNSKSYAVLDTFLTATKEIRALPLSIVIDEGGTKC